MLPDDATEDDEVVENSRSYKRDSNGRLASTGADLHKQKEPLVSCPSPEVVQLQALTSGSL